MAQTAYDAVRYAGDELNGYQFLWNTQNQSDQMKLCFVYHSSYSRQNHSLSSYYSYQKK